MKPSFAIRGKRNEILEIAARYGASNVRVFGSVARGEDTEKSDLDLLVDMDEERPLSDLGEFVADVQDALHCKVQAVISDSLHRLLKDRILGEASPL
jgi:predicted nucleotidyltransferase